MNERIIAMRVDVPEALHCAFRDACKEADRSMQGQVRQLIKQWLLERSNGESHPTLQAGT